ncbi:sporulation protein SsgA [Streptomyces subrutilus]|uniref:sporulation protein SsgA n=1 Tax=Streptomyces subrutilus TaxID=36818 RepID=UPI002E0DC94B|nr:sporulation protein SsgA [Streptomyces subrutilus]
MAKDVEKAQEDRLGGESSASGMKAWLWHRAKPYTPPWIVTGGVGIVGTVASLPWEGSAFAGVGLTLASVGLTVATWHAAKATGVERRLHSAITVAAGTSWVTCAALAGPMAGPMPHLFAIGGVTLAASWNIRQVLGRAIPTTAVGDSSGLLDAIGLAKLKLGKATVTETGQVRMPFTLEKGATAEELTKVLPNLESATDVRPGGYRVERDPESHRHGVLVGVPVDPLSGTTWYPGPSAPGGSITEPLVVGTYDDTLPLEMVLPKGVHWLITGETGSGKTEAAMDILCEVLTRTDVAVWLSDPVKRGMDLGGLFPACDWVAVEPDDVEAMATAVMQSTPARAEWLRRHSYRQWVPESAVTQTSTAHSCQAGRACGCAGLPFLLAWFEEAAEAFARLDEELFKQAANQIRATGAALVFSLQRPSHDQMSTTVRAALPSALVFGLDERDETLALPGDVLDAGAHPGQWGAGFPGYCYLVEAGTALARQITPARTFRNDPVALEWVTATFADVRVPDAGEVMTSVATAVAGGRYTNRRAALAPVPAAGPQPESDHDIEEQSMGGPLVDPEDDDLDPTVDLEESQDGDDFSLVPEDTRQDLSPEDAREAMEVLLDEWHAQGRTTVTPADLIAYSDQLDRKTTWIKNVMREMRAAGRLVEDLNAKKPGVYKIRPRELAGV